MGSRVQSDVERWWERSAAQEIATDQFAQIDIDALCDDPPRLAVTAAIDAVQEGLRLARPSYPWATGLVSIPLEASESLVADCPRLEELLARDWHYGPGHEAPGIYLLRPELLDEAAHEDLRIDVSSTGALPEGFHAYYRCWRSAEEAERGWEYSRTVYVRSP